MKKIFTIFLCMSLSLFSCFIITPAAQAQENSTQFYTEKIGDTTLNIEIIGFITTVTAEVDGEFHEAVYNNLTQELKYNDEVIEPEVKENLENIGESLLRLGEYENIISPANVDPGGIGGHSYTLEQLNRGSLNLKHFLETSLVIQLAAILAKSTPWNIVAAIANYLITKYGDKTVYYSELIWSYPDPSWPVLLKAYYHQILIYSDSAHSNLIYSTSFHR